MAEAPRGGRSCWGWPPQVAVPRQCRDQPLVAEHRPGQAQPGARSAASAWPRAAAKAGRLGASMRLECLEVGGVADQ